MDANNFVARLKANGTENDLCDLAKVIDEYKDILSKLPSKDRGSFSLNVLCILCRNIDKVPSWREKIDPKLLLSLSIECVKETLALKRADQVKLLACVYHIHRYIVRLKHPIPPKLVLHLSSVPFHREMLPEHAKTYWSVLADRITYMELLKDGNISIIKLLPKLTEDILKLIQIYDTAQFFANILMFLIKKLNFLYTDLHSVELNTVFGQIFDSLATKSDLESLKKLSSTELLDVYVKLNNCFYVIIKNSWKKLSDSVFSDVVTNCIRIFVHCPEISHCLKTFYLDTFCNIFKTINGDCESIFKNLLKSCETSKDSKMVYATYPFLNQMLRLYIDYILANVKDFEEKSHEHSLKVIYLIMRKSKHCDQLLKCDNCNIRSGFHDALRLSFLSVHFIKFNTKIDNILPTFFSILQEQHIILKELKKLECRNHEKCYKKLQTDTHNTAILLYKSKLYESSIKLFNIYLENEIASFKEDADLKNISRALYNKSICQLDCMQYEDALKNGFLSLVFACPEGLNSNKHMSLVIDIKAKALKASEDDSEDKLQLISVLDACKICCENHMYGNLKPFFAPLKFSLLLKHEFSMYRELWPSIAPIAGVLKSLRDLANNDYACVPAENEDAVMSILYDMILVTSTIVRSVHNDHYKDIVADVIAQFDCTPATSTELQMVQAAMLFLKAEFDLHDAGEKYGWKHSDPNPDPDDASVSRTVCQEHEATRRAIQAVELMTDVLPDIATVAVTNKLKLVLEISSIFVQRLLHLSRKAHGLQLAHVCCALAKRIGDQQAYMMNAGVVISHADKQTDKHIISDIMASAACAESLAGDDPEYIETALVFMCDVAIYKLRCGAVGVAAKLLRTAQTKIQSCINTYPNINLDLAIGRVLEAQCLLCGDCGPGTLSAVNFAQRHYLSMTNFGRRRPSRLYSTTRSLHSLSTCCLSVRAAAALCLSRRARAWRASAANDAAVTVAGTHATMKDLDCVNIDNRLKYILGMQPNDAYQKNTSKTDAKPQMFTPKPDIEVMLENMTFKKTQVSPSMPCVSIPGCKIPAFLNHKQCDCYACEIPQVYVLAAFTVGLEAAMYFRAMETEIAKNYFEGASKCFQLAERKLKEFNVEKCGMFISEVKRSLFTEFKNLEVEMLIEAAFFELSVGNNEKGDEIVVRIHEILNEYDINGYLRNDVLNLMVTAAETRQNVKKNADTSLEEETLKLPANIEPPKTPEIKAKVPPLVPKIIVQEEELPKKRKVIKLNLDEAEQKEKMTKKKTDFKIPVPATKPKMELITPRNTRSKPSISTQSDTETPSKEVFLTPSTSEEFFTPMSTLKTYAGKSLRKNIVKNLESEFSTPKGDMLQPKSTKSKDSKKILKRATSPGKLVKPTTSGRTTRRQNVE